jgi:CheY-like chemotaxis protein
MLPDMEGWEVLVALKDDPELAHIPVIIITMRDDKNKGFALGASDYLVKPVDSTTLVETLEKYRPPTEDKVHGHILVIEDDLDLSTVMRESLEAAHWKVTTAYNGRVGIESVQDAVPDLILLDLMMPEMNGFEFVDVLRTRPKWRAIPIVVITARQLTEAERDQLSGSVEQILQKGAYSRNALLAYIHKLVMAHVQK